MMNWLDKKILTKNGGEQTHKNQPNSNCYFYKTLYIFKNFTEQFLEKTSNLCSKLTFVSYDRIRREDPLTTGKYSTKSKHFYTQRFCSKFFQLLTPRNEEELLNTRGSVLIEFAICMPILIILLFYVHDLMKIKRYYAQTEFVAQQMANMIQNISQKRTNKKITKTDIRHAIALSSLTLFPGKSLYYQNGVP